MTDIVPEHLKDEPAYIAAAYMALGREGTVCPHGIDYLEGSGRGRLAIKGTDWVCGCCCNVHQGPMPDGGRCRQCKE